VDLTEIATVKEWERMHDTKREPGVGGHREKEECRVCLGVVWQNGIWRVHKSKKLDVRQGETVLWNSPQTQNEWHPHG